jgi:2-polyprenyl-6-methoxyphenol hydroxylase-like FAD-dependent oxidoreductase
VDYVDVAIIGGGPAALAAACALACSNRRIALIGQGKKAIETTRLGETLTPAILMPLKELGLLEAFEGLRLPAIEGFESIWGSSNREWRSSTSSLRGGGWCLQRGGFERLLQEEAKRRGVMIIEDQVVRVGSRLDKVMLLTKSSCPEPHVASRFVLYANGRPSGERMHHVRQLTIDKLIGCVGHRELLKGRS